MTRGEFRTVLKLLDVKERGGELLISRITFILGALFLLISFIMTTGIIK